MRQYRSLLISAAVLLIVVFCAWRAPYHEPVRSWLIVQTKPLVKGIDVRTEDLQVLPYDGYNFIRIPCRYIGGNPNDKYILRATIRTSANGPEIDPGWAWQKNLTQTDSGDFTAMWEFQSAPEQAWSIIFRLYVTPREQEAPGSYIDFTIPYFPKQIHF